MEANQTVRKASGSRSLWVASQMPFGKKLPTAIYIARPQPAWTIGAELVTEVKRAEAAAQPHPDWNLLKIHTTEAAYTFLTYPDFDNDPHPALAEAMKINLSTGSIVRTDYRTRTNPPTLHRKETFLPPSDSRGYLSRCSHIAGGRAGGRCVYALRFGRQCSQGHVYHGAGFSFRVIRWKRRSAVGDGRNVAGALSRVIFL